MCEPIAIIGLSCRFPGANSAAEYWAMLAGSRCAVSEVPRDRWDSDRFYDADPDKHGTICSRYGCFLSDIDQFDASFFGISPREAKVLDPQQRILLEVSWHALEDAGLVPFRPEPMRAGVFV